MVPKKSQKSSRIVVAEPRRRRGPLERWVRDALIHLHDGPYLAVHPLAPQDRSGSLRSGQALQQRLLEALETLRSEENVTSVHGGRYRLMVLRYVEGLGIAEVCARLSISLSEYHRVHGPTLAAVAATFAAEVPNPAGGGAGPAGYRTPFFGREAELGALRRQFAEVRSGSTARFVLVQGDAGVGKTRLARELGAFTASSGARFLQGAYPREVADT